MRKISPRRRIASCSYVGRRARRHHRGPGFGLLRSVSIIRVALFSSRAPIVFDRPASQQRPSAHQFSFSARPTCGSCTASLLHLTAASSYRVPSVVTTKVPRKHNHPGMHSRPCSRACLSPPPLAGRLEDELQAGLRPVRQAYPLWARPEGSRGLLLLCLEPSLPAPRAHTDMPRARGVAGQPSTPSPPCSSPPRSTFLIIFLLLVGAAGARVCARACSRVWVRARRVAWPVFVRGCVSCGAIRAWCARACACACSLL